MAIDAFSVFGKDKANNGIVSCTAASIAAA